MKILLVAGKLTYSNPAHYTVQLVQGLIKRGHEVEVAALGGPLYSQIKKLGVQSYILKYNYFSFRRLVQYLRDFGPEVIHATGGSKALHTATRFSRLLSTPLIHTVHSWLPEDRGRLPSTVNGIVVVNEDLR